MKVEKVAIPQKSVLAATKFDYADSYKGGVINDEKGEIDSLAVGRAFFSSSPKWIDGLFALRNKLVSLVGLKTGESDLSREEIIKNFRGEKGEKVGLFQVFDRNENEIILGEDDKHLDFRVSLFIEPADVIEKNLIITTTVNFKNAFGKLYFLPVKPFHQIIVPAMLKETLKILEKQL